MVLEDEVAHVPAHALGVEQLSGHAGQTLDVAGMLQPAVLVRGEGSLHVLRPGQFLGDGDGVIDGLRAALGEVLQHRMGGVAQQGHPAVHPHIRRFAVIHGPADVAAEVLAGVLHGVAALGEAGVEFLRGAPVVVVRGIRVGLEDRHVVVQLSAAQRVLDQVHVRAQPAQHGGGGGDVLAHGFDGDRAAVGHVLGRHQVVIDDGPAQVGPHAVGPDHCFGKVLGAGEGLDQHRTVGLVGGAEHLRVGLQLDPAALLAGLQQCGVQVRAVRDDVGVAVVRLELFTEVNGGNGLAGDGVNVDLPLRDHGVLLDLVQHAQPVQRGEGIGGQLDAGAHLGEFGGAFQDEDVLAGTGEAGSGGKPADSSAYHQGVDLRDLLRHLLLSSGADSAASY